MKTITAVERRPFRYLNSLIFITALVALAWLSNYNLIASYLFKFLAFIVTPYFITAGFSFSQRKKQIRLTDFVEEIAVGVYEPEDERDQVIKTEAAMAAFRIMMLICWLVAGTVLVISKEFSAAHEIIFWFPTILSAIGAWTFRYTMRKNGIDLGYEGAPIETRKKS